MCEGNLDDIIALNGFPVTKTFITNDQREGRDTTPPKTVVQNLTKKMVANLAADDQVEPAAVEKDDKYQNFTFNRWSDRSGTKHYAYARRQPK